MWRAARAALAAEPPARSSLRGISCSVPICGQVSRVPRTRSTPTSPTMLSRGREEGLAVSMAADCRRGPDAVSINKTSGLKYLLTPSGGRFAVSHQRGHVDLVAAVLLQHLQARRQHFVDRQHGGAEERGVVLTVRQHDARLGAADAAADRAMPGLCQGHQPLDQHLGRRTADDDGARVEHVLDHADRVAQPVGRLAAPALQGFILGLLQPLREVDGPDIVVRHPQCLGQ
mmetsp:Transcript_6619/g.27539  ORF Transcript_6619/g.27539 Transcript_6619/m.27539 type:complete len:230 (-) Transcript_6619:3818-4507(-)